MRTYQFDFTIKKPFANLFRETVCIIVQDPSGNYLLGAKPGFFPPTITRLLGGGMKPGETPLDTAWRETKEELGVDLQMDDFEHESTLAITAVDEAGSKYTTKIHLVRVLKPVAKYRAGDDVAAIDHLDNKARQELIRNYQNLSANLWYNGVEGIFCWQDYGKVYAVVHEKAIE